jgi:histidinol-phosphatase (PHP family)
MKRFNVGFEVNTSSLRKGMDEPMPESSLVAALRKEGIETVTVGSDAHRPRDVGKGIEIALKIIRECGFDSPSSFDKRRASPFVVQESS